MGGTVNGHSPMAVVVVDNLLVVILGYRSAREPFGK